MHPCSFPTLLKCFLMCYTACILFMTNNIWWFSILIRYLGRSCTARIRLKFDVIILFVDDLTSVGDYFCGDKPANSCTTANSGASRQRLLPHTVCCLDHCHCILRLLLGFSDLHYPCHHRRFLCECVTDNCVKGYFNHSFFVGNCAWLTRHTKFCWIISWLVVPVS